MWLWWILASCVVLGLYDLCKKASVQDNAVFPTLLGSTAFGWIAVTVFLLLRGVLAAVLDIPPRQIGLLLVKSCIVGASWTATYMALKTLPITFAAPIRATGPLWTLIGAILLFSEIPTWLQAIGMAMVIVGCFLFSRSAAKEGIDFVHSRAVLLAFLGTVLGSCSALYDKHLLKGLSIPTGTVLWWFMGGMCVIYSVATGIWLWKRSDALECRQPTTDDRQPESSSLITHRSSFSWRWTIPLVGILLAASDACYFNAVSMPDAKISVLSMVRRSSVVLTFFLGGAVFREANIRRKAVALAVVLAGVVVLCLCK